MGGDLNGHSPIVQTDEPDLPITFPLAGPAPPCPTAFTTHTILPVLPWDWFAIQRYVFNIVQHSALLTTYVGGTVATDARTRAGG